MKAIARIPALAILVSVLLLWACNDPISIGSDLLDDNRADVKFVDTMAITVESYIPDSVVAGPRLLLSNYACGKFEDPVFGSTEAAIFAHLLVPNSTESSLTGAELDSIRLVLPFDTLTNYGNINLPLELEIHRLAEKISLDQTYYTDKTFATEAAKLDLNSGPFLPNPKADRTVLNYTSDTQVDTFSFPHLRIPLEDALGTELLSLDPAVYLNDSLFFEKFKGIRIQGVGTQPGLLSFDLFSSRGGILVYYRKDGKNRQLHFPFYVAGDLFSAARNGGKVLHVKHDYTGSQVAPFIGATGRTDSLIPLQSINGLQLRVQFPNLAALGNIIINQAELEFTVADMPGDDINLFTRPAQLLPYEINSSGRVVPIRDVSIAVQLRGQDYNIFTGGNPVRQSDGRVVYKINLTSHFQRIIDQSAQAELIIAPHLLTATTLLSNFLFLNIEQPGRTVFYGTAHPSYRAKLNLLFTSI